tara:strand:+ start:359 stop:808 length:450 start_codon:yes stop_codon:yes gene_type:complete
MFSFLYTIFDTILDWIGLKDSGYSNKGLDDVMRESLYEHIQYDKEYIENRKSFSKYNDIYEIYDILEKDFNLILPKLTESDNLIDWFNESIAEATETKDINKKIKLLLLKVEYEKWRDIQKRDTSMRMKESLLGEDLSIDDYIEIMNES